MLMKFFPEGFSQNRVMLVMRKQLEFATKTNTVLYPSSNVLHRVEPDDGELFTCPFLRLPEPVDGNVQFGRERMQSSSIKPELLHWIFSEKNPDPIVYMAWGTIVSTFDLKIMVKKVFEALKEGPWRCLIVVPQESIGVFPKDLDKERWRLDTFVPQADVLRCDRVRCFISHNGANSTMESLACGVPLLCFPFFMDQYDWAWTVRRHLCAGIQVCKGLTPVESLRRAVREVVEEPIYRQNAKVVALRMHAHGEAVMQSLGPEMAPKKAMLGPGVSVAAAVVLALIKNENVQEIFDIVAKTIPK